jgi:hypothetical protein
VKNLLITLLLRFLPCAFDPANMNRIQAGTTTLWIYKTTADTLAQITASAYFDAHAPLLRQGDVIIAVDVGTGQATHTVTSADNATPVTTSAAT